jgi:hypothetical protein
METFAMLTVMGGFLMGIGFVLGLGAVALYLWSME